MTCLLLLIAFGWSIRFINFDDSDIFLPLGILLGVIHIVIVGLSQISEGDSYKFHDYENWAGIVLCVIRILLYIYGVTLYVDSYEKADE